MSWLKKFVSYARDIPSYNVWCTCPVHTEFQTAVIINVAKKLKLNLEILQNIDSAEPLVPRGLEISRLNEKDKKKILNDLKNELCKLEEKFVNHPRNKEMLKHLIRIFSHTGNVSLFEQDILFSPISIFYNNHKQSINKG